MLTGNRMYVYTCTLSGRLDVGDCNKATEYIIKSLKMNIAYPPVVYKYPKDGKGGFGYTLFQTITESYIVWDVWEMSGNIYLVICSCKSFLPTRLTKIFKSLDLHVRRDQYMRMGADDVAGL